MSRQHHSDRLEQVTRYLSDPRLDGRAPGTEGHEIAAKYIEAQMRDLAMRPLFDDGYGQDVPAGSRTAGRNLCGCYPGKTPRTILLGAHYDHFPGIPGADDNAAAVAIVMSAAAQLREWDGQAQIAFCFFDLEEPPNFLGETMGSNYFAANCPFDLGLLDCAIVLDLCGHDVPLPGAENVLFAMGAEFHEYLVSVVRSAGSDELPILMARNERIGDMSDHHAFRVRGCPFLFLSCGWWPHYHQPTDTFEKLNLAKMGAIAAALVVMVRRLDGLAPTPAERAIAPANFDEIEAETLRRLTGMDIPPEPKALRAAAERIIRKLA